MLHGSRDPQVVSMPCLNLPPLTLPQLWRLITKLTVAFPDSFIDITDASSWGCVRAALRANQPHLIRVPSGIWQFVGPERGCQAAPLPAEPATLHRPVGHSCRSMLFARASAGVLEVYRTISAASAVSISRDFDSFQLHMQLFYCSTFSFSAPWRIRSRLHRRPPC